jgi:flavin-dependent dehydrogenase
MAVTVVERAFPPIDKACGEGLMPDAVALLREIGVEPRGLPFRGIRYFDGRESAEGIFPGHQGLGVRRVELQGALAARAEETGVRLLWGAKALGLAGGRVETDEGMLQGRFVVGAAGLHSRVRKWAGLERRPSRDRRFGVRRHFAIAPWSDFVEVYWSEKTKGRPACEAYVTPVAEDEVGVALLWGEGKADFDSLLDGLPLLGERLAGAEIRSRDRGAGPFHQRVRGVHKGCVALVGDAAGYLDAITGEGLAVALHESKALVQAMERGDLARYARAHRRINRLPNRMTRVVLALEKRPALRRRADRKSTRLNSSHNPASRMPSSA